MPYVWFEELRQPEEEEPPDRVGEELAGGEGPCLPVAQQASPGDPDHRLDGVAADVGQFRRRDARVLLGPAVDRQPGGEPGEARRARDDERPPPAVSGRDPGHDQRRDDRPDVRAGVEDPRGEGALRLREPLGHRLDRRGEIARFAQSQREPRHAEAEGRSRQRVAHRRQAPADHGEAEPHPRAQAVHQAAHDELAGRIRPRERGRRSSRTRTPTSRAPSATARRGCRAPGDPGS